VKHNKSYESRKQVMWGLLLIGFGAAVLLDRMDMFEFHDMWHYWPLILTVFGINKMIGFPTAKEFCSGLWLTSLGVWLFANFEHLYGLEWQTSWPILIIVLGVNLIIEPILKNRFDNKESPQ
jgi:putative Mn2+ efflux pump MntP